MEGPLVGHPAPKTPYRFNYRTWDLGILERCLHLSDTNSRLPTMLAEHDFSRASVSTNSTYGTSPVPAVSSGFAEGAGSTSFKTGKGRLSYLHTTGWAFHKRDETNYLTSGGRAFQGLSLKCYAAPHHRPSALQVFQPAPGPPAPSTVTTSSLPPLSASSKAS